MDNKAFYFPWVRKGLGGYINEKETLQGTAKGRPSLTIRTNYQVQHNQQTEEEDAVTATEMFLEKTVKFVGPGDVTRVNASAVMKVHPNEGSDSFAIQCIPYVEFWEPDFLWRYTPAVHSDNQLRPWLALVACRKDDIKLMTDSEGATFFSFIGDDAAWKRTFPDIDDLFRTAHAQGSAEERPEFCRLLGLRNGDASLDPNTEYVAMLIPSYEAGRQRGLGFGEDAIKEIIAQQPAWEKDLAVQGKRPRGTEFPVYYKWSFKTKEETFDDLAKAIAPCSVKKSGLKLDVTDMGEGFSYNTVNHQGCRTSITMPAATVTSGFPEQSAFPAKSGNSDEPTLYKRLEDLLKQNQVFLENKADIEGGIQEVLEGDEDPLIMPPVYGARHAMSTSLHDSSKPWVDELNLDIHHRAAAGLGRQVVQKHQEELMDRAWKQVEAVQALNMELYKRLLSIRTNQSLQGKTVDSFGKTEDDQVDNAKYIAYMMRYLSSMKEAGADKYKLSDIIKNAGIPASFAAPTFQNNVERISRIVSGLDTTTLMEHIVEDQLFKFETPDPAGSIDPVELEKWCRESKEALIFREYKNYWKDFYHVSLDKSNELELTPKVLTYGDHPSSNASYLDSAWTSLAYSFFHFDLGSERGEEDDFYGNNEDAFGSLLNTLDRFQPSNYRVRVFAISDTEYDNFAKQSFVAGMEGATINGRSVPVHSYVVSNELFDRYFDSKNTIAQIGKGNNIRRFMKKPSPSRDVKLCYTGPFEGSGDLGSIMSNYGIKTRIKPYYEINDEALHLFLYHYYYYNTKRSFSTILNLFVSVYKNVLTKNGISYSFAEEVLGYCTGEAFVDPNNYDFFYKKERDQYDKVVIRYQTLINCFSLKYGGYVNLYNNVKEGSLLRFLVYFVKHLAQYPGLVAALWKEMLGTDNTSMPNLCYAGESTMASGMFALLLVSGAKIDVFENRIRPILNKLDRSLDVPAYIVIPQRYVSNSMKTYDVNGLRDIIKITFPNIQTLEDALPIIETLKKKVQPPKPEEPKSTVDDKAVEGLQQSIVKQSTDEKDAYTRIKEVAGRYYELFFSDTEEGDKLRGAYLDDLLMSKYPILAYPFFPEPTYYYLKLLSDKFIIPGLDEIEPETVAMFINNPQFTESFLCGMNTEMGSELQWREYPTDRRGSYFRKFWDSDSSIEAITGDKFFDVKPLHLWENSLGKNHLGEKGNLLIFAIRSKLLKLYPSTRIYLNKAEMKAGSTTEIDFAKDRKDPVMETFIREDLLLVGFDISLSEALGNPKIDNYGYMLTFEQDVDDLEFQYDKNNKNWRKNTSSESAGAIIDTPSAFGKHVSLFVNTEK